MLKYDVETWFTLLEIVLFEVVAVLLTLLCW